jgi:hypothetical protein
MVFRVVNMDFEEILLNHLLDIISDIAFCTGDKLSDKDIENIKKAYNKLDIQYYEELIVEDLFEVL